MSEEEIIKSCEEIIKSYQHFEDIREKDKQLGLFQWNNYDEIFSKQKKAIQGLLDLYNKQKERVVEDDLVKYCRRTLPKDTIAIMMCNDDFCRNFGNDFISKDKIKAKIEELKEEIKGIIDKEKDVEDYQCEQYYKIQVLQELLESD